jgi:hypothetical protein
LDWLCELVEHNGVNYRAVVARAIQMRAAAVAISEMVAKNTVNICTLYNLEGLNAKRNLAEQRIHQPPDVVGAKPAARCDRVLYLQTDAAIFQNC